MHRPRVFRLLVAACCLYAGPEAAITAWAEAGPAWAEPGFARAEPVSAVGGGLCEIAGAAAEQAHGLPPGLLVAIGRVESGRWDGVRERMAPWPWTINTAGRGQWFETVDEAMRAVRVLMEGGARSIDVGCFQINMLHHPHAFQTLEQGFDPMANAAYAARFLTGLQTRTGSWEGAVAAYHSSDSTRGLAYRQQVFAAWLSAGGPGVGAAVQAQGRGALSRPFDRPARMAEAAPLPPPLPRVIPLPLPGTPIAGVRVWTPMPVGSAPGMVAMPPPMRAMMVRPIMPGG